MRRRDQATKLPSYPSDEQVRWHEVRAADGTDATGLEINPYSYRFHGEQWYNVWDASSGVIWDTDAVTGCLLLATRCADGRYAVNEAVPGGDDLACAGRRARRRARAARCCRAPCA